MDCVYDCPKGETRFTFLRQTKTIIRENYGSGLSRKDFFWLAVVSLLSLGFLGRKGLRLLSRSVSIIRPPAALKEEEFVNRCVRCGNCMKVCITNGLHPVLLQAGLAGVWTPQLIPEIGYCEYKCTLCGNVCPTGAIRRLSLEEKMTTRLGLAEIDKQICLPWAEGRQCIVCQEHCPIADKAIKLQGESQDAEVLLKPVVDARLCVGCGICQNKCPTRPMRAIRVVPFSISNYE